MNIWLADVIRRISLMVTWRNMRQALRRCSGISIAMELRWLMYISTSDCQRIRATRRREVTKCS